MFAADSTIAKKHIDISIRVKQIAGHSCPHCHVYLATHRIGKAGQFYQHIEQVSGEEFWSVKAWTPPPRHNLKDPDVVITQWNQVEFFVEVKWGAVRGGTNTDLLLSPEEWGRMARLLDRSAICRARGPAVKDGRCYHSPLPLRGDYSINDNTKLVIVSDFLLVKELLGAELQEFLRLWKSANVDILVADINIGVGKIPSFQEVMEA